jgi:hypothetical protein
MDVQRDAAGIIEDAAGRNCSRSTQLLSQLGSGGTSPQNVERDLMRAIQREREPAAS